MSEINGPFVVRRPPSPYFAKPGVHSHNITRRIDNGRPKEGLLTILRLALLLIGLSGLGYYAYSVSDQYIFEAYQNWSFDQQISGHPAVTFADYLREKTPFGFLVGAKPAEAHPSGIAVAPKTVPTEVPRPIDGSVLGRVEIPRLNLSAMVREGVDAKTLDVAVGHVSSTALPGQPGNFAIAAHRDTLFRALKDIKKGDLVSFESGSGTFSYQVMATKIVKPSDVSVLNPDGGGLITSDSSYASKSGEPGQILTMITCYPFYYVGSAPKRFIVEAKLIPAKNAEEPSPPASAAVSTPPERNEPVASSSLSHKRSSSHLAKNVSAQHEETQRAGNKPAKKRTFWHKVFRLS